MTLYLLWNFNGIDETCLQDVFKDKSKAEAKAKEFNDNEINKSKQYSHYVKNEFYVDEWELIE